MGIDFLSKTLYLEDRTVRLQLWDTAGQEKFRALIPSYVRQATGALVVYDVTSKESFQNAAQWIEDVRAMRGNDVVLALVGNKQDLQDRRVVSTAEGEELAKKMNVIFMETSAKTNYNIKTVFKKLAMTLPHEGLAHNPIDIRPEKTPEVTPSEGCQC